MDLGDDVSGTDRPRKAGEAAVMGCRADAARAYEQAGLLVVYLGDEAVLDLDRFGLRAGRCGSPGRAGTAPRTSCWAAVIA